MQHETEPDLSRRRRARSAAAVGAAANLALFARGSDDSDASADAEEPATAGTGFETACLAARTYRRGMKFNLAHGWNSLVLAISALALAAACTSAQQGTIGDPDESAQEQSAAEDYTPPLSFGSEIVRAEVEAHFIDDDLLYTLDATDPVGARADSITSWSIDSGEITGTVFVDDIASDLREYGNQRARFAKVDGKVVLIYARVTESEDPQTGDATESMNVTMLDAEDGATIWDSSFVMSSPTGSDSRLDGSGSMDIRSVSDDHVIITGWNDDFTGLEAWVLDTADGERTALDLDVAPVVENDGVLAGWRLDLSQTRSIVGIELESGDAVWELELGPTSDIVHLGDGLLAAYEYAYEYESALQEAGGAFESVTQSNRVIDAASGEELIAFETESEGTVSCLHDGFGLVGCADEERSYLEVFDAGTGESVWSSRHVPVDWNHPDLLSAFSKGVLYVGDTYDSSFAAIDAYTGEYLTEALPAAFTEVGTGYGLHVGEEWDSPLALTLYPAAIDHGAVLGVEVADTPNAVETSGAVVVSVKAGSPAEQAGLLEDDLIVAINDSAVGSASDLVDLIALYEPGQTVEVWFNRGAEGESQSTQVTLDGT
ncbi:PDZ domain-containing protein [Glycomyces buryatensis]|uniref:PDZ domain-containing protein n=1 Tax=Glycomyces buryatensis TaxID=2570927 RepID=A0A4S8QEJ3_9ACTN|nr:PDZ domain-containing protein [Glycomyces buryatensis]THV42760.1 PDZ domain-containing protein [Glycomyces buryatensis]